ncbi:uncharacterized protein TNCV_950181 [Trichonephila clavipes]|nr:uncharacterized protein TNCV_950181 [Trichonephila clavipes]
MERTIDPRTALHCRRRLRLRRLGDETAPNASIITHLVQGFRDSGSVADRKERYSVHNESDKCGDRCTNKTIEKTFRLHKHHYKIHIFAESDKKYAWLQKDGEYCHTSWHSMEVLTEFFEDRVIFKGLWPTRLPELSIQDFFNFRII